MTTPASKPQDGWAVVNDFLTDIYGADDVEQVWLAGFKDIEKGASWFGMQGLSRLKSRVTDPNEADLYFCSGLIREGANNRTLGEVVSQPLLYADDIGTKVDRAAWDVMFALGFPRPTFCIETSPGNETWGWKLDGDATTPERWADLALIRAYMIQKNLTDALHDPTRYLRLPWGHNSKPKYRDSKGRAPAVGYAEWHPGRTADLDVIGQVLIGREDWRSADVPPSAMTSQQLSQLGQGALVRHATMEDPIVRMAAVIGLDPRPSSREGVIEALCPNWHAHGDRPETGFAFLGGNLCHCNHASCDDLRSPDFIAMIRSQYEDHVSALEAMGQRPEELPLSAAHFEARALFEQHGVEFGEGSEASEELVRAEADELAARNARRVAQAQEDHEVALRRLAERFIWVGPAGGFYDVEERTILNREGVDYHDAVKDHIVPGTSGKNRACNVIRAHPDNPSVAGLTYRPGNDRAVVMATTEQGTNAEHINLWVPPGLTARAELPRAWLQMVNFIIPAREFRHWFVRWLAYQVQNAGSRTPCIPLIVGKQGTGKDLMLAPFIKVLGAHNVEFVGMTRLESNFNEWQRAALVVLPELKLSSDGKLYNQLKDWTGQNAGRVVINGKYARTYSMEPVANFIAFTNHLDAVRGMETDDRRIAPYVSPAEPKAKIWYRSIARVLNSEAEAERLLAFLSAVDLSDFNPHDIPKDDGSKQVMLADNLSDKARWIYDQLIPGGALAERHYLTIKEVEEFAVAEGPQSVKYNLSSNAIRDAMNTAGCESIGQVRAERGRVSLWFGPGMAAVERETAKLAGTKDLAHDAIADRENFIKQRQAALLGAAA